MAVMSLQDAILLLRLEPQNQHCEASMDNLPLVTAALICERVIQEKDGVLSAIRIVDRAEVKVQTTEPNVNIQDVVPGVQFNGLISLKSGSFKGSAVLSVEGQSPSGKTKSLGDYPVTLEGEDDNGQNLVLNLMIASKEDGLHWFNIRFNGTLLTRIPLRLTRVLERVPTDVQTSQQPKM